MVVAGTAGTTLRGGGNGNSNSNSNNNNNSLSSRFIVRTRGGGGSSRGVYNNNKSHSLRWSKRRFLCSSIVIASLLCLVLMNLVYLHGRLDGIVPTSSSSSAAAAVQQQHPAHLFSTLIQKSRLRTAVNYNTTTVTTNEQEQHQQSTTAVRRRQTEAAAITAGAMAFSRHTGGISYENDILKRIHQDLQIKWKACAIQTQQQQQQQDGQQQQQQQQHAYKRYGLLQVLDEYFVEHNNNNNNNNDNSQTTTISNNKHDSLLSQSSTSSSCVLPKASFTACNVTSMAMIAYTTTPTTTTTSSSNNHEYDHQIINHRRVLLSIMQWLLDPRVHEIWLLVPVQQRPFFVNNSAYGQRLLLWEFNNNNNNRHEQEQLFRNNNPGQQVFVVFCESLMQGVSIVEAESQEIALLWINANPTAATANDVLSTDTRNVLFRAWQQEASAIHVSLSTPSLLLEWQGSNTTRSSSSLSSSRLAISSSSCPFQPSLSTIQGNTQEDQWQQQQQLLLLPDLAGTMHHRSYLCFLQHPVLAKSITSMSSSSPLKSSSSWSNIVYSASALWLWMVASSSSSSSSSMTTPMSSPASEKTVPGVIPGVVGWPVEHKDATTAKVQYEKRNPSLSDSAVWFYFGEPTEILTKMMNTDQTTIQRRHHAQSSSLCDTSHVTGAKQVGFFWN